MIHSAAVGLDKDDQSASGGGVGEEHGDTQPYEPSAPPLDLRVIALVKGCRVDADSSYGATTGKGRRCFVTCPALLSSELGMSIDDASAELCGLLRAVGEGAEFRFEKSDGGGASMVFYFPPDFERRALRRRRVESTCAVLWSILGLSIRILKILVAFGLVLSLVMLSIASICAMVAALIVMMRGGDHGGGGGAHYRAGLSRRIRSAFFMLRQVLWCYALAVPGINGGQDPSLGETAGNAALGLSVCCGDPRSLFFWWRLSMLNRRREQLNRGWGSGGRRRDSDGWWNAHEEGSEEGFSLIRRGQWGQEGGRVSRAVGFGNGDGPTGADEGYRGFLSIAVEFLFGPEPFDPGPCEADRWRLRAQAILALNNTAALADPQKKGLSLEELAPYTDEPTDDYGPKMVAEVLRVVSHFNGRPSPLGQGGEKADGDAGAARFVFPELVAGSVRAGADLFFSSMSVTDADDTSNSDKELLFSSDEGPSPSGGGGWTIRGGVAPRSAESPAGAQAPSRIPPFLRERRHVLTRMNPRQFSQCCLLGVLNFAGVLLLRGSIGKGGLLEIRAGALYSVARDMLGVFVFYAKVFILLPLGRLGLICWLNSRVDRRNARRKAAAKRLLERQHNDGEVERMGAVSTVC